MTRNHLRLLSLTNTMEFRELTLDNELLHSLKRIGIETPTEVQAEAIPVMLSGKDVIVRAKTGSGKTFAFLLPVLQELTEGLQALIVVPTRELALQINKEATKLSRCETVTIYGGVGINPQIDKLRTAQIAIATPGRLLDHMERGTIDLSQIKYVILDEADRMLDMGFIDDVRKIMSALPKKKQVSLFSATMPSPVIALANDYMHEPQQILLQQDEITVDKIKQECLAVDRKEKLNHLVKLLKSNTGKTIIFCNTKTWAEKLSQILKRKRFNTLCIHSGLSQRRRSQVIHLFNKGKADILVATDLAARGIHIDDVTQVVNYDVPRNPKDYVHRIGRTGRAGQDGKAITLVTNLDQALVANIETEIQMRLPIKGADGSVKQERKPVAVSSGHGDDWGLD